MTHCRPEVKYCKNFYHRLIMHVTISGFLFALPTDRL